MKLHHKIIRHIHKHHKKYIFWAGVALGITTIKTLIITGVFVGIQLHVGKSQASYEHTNMVDIIQITDQIQTLAHDFLDEKLQRWEIEDENIVSTFKQLNEWYNNASNLNEKYRRAKQMEAFFDQMDKQLHAKNAITTPEEIQKDEEYHRLKEQLDNVQ